MYMLLFGPFGRHGLMTFWKKSVIIVILRCFKWRPLTKLSIYCKFPLLLCEMNIMISGAFACVFAEFHFDRKFEYYLLQTYFPSMLVVMLSWVSFWIDPAAVPARISLGLLTVLTMTTQTSVLNSRLPRFIHKIILFFFTSLRRLITVCMSM